MTEDATERLRRAAEDCRGLDREIADLTDLLKIKTARRQRLLHEELPAMMDAAGVDEVGLPARGNMPPFRLRVVPYFRAGIAASWPEARKERAFGLLELLGAGDLIKTTVVASLPRGALERARRLVAAAGDLGIEAGVAESVHSATLTAWLKEVYLDRGQALSADQLEALGASVGRVAKIEEREA